MSGFETSALAGRVLFAAALANGDDPLDTVLWRDCVLNNALHWADSAGQTLINWSATDPAYSGATSPWRIAEPLNADEWAPITPLGPLSLRVRRGVRPYRWRFRLAGASTMGDAIDLALVWGRTRAELLSKAEAGSGDQVRWTGVTGTSPAWLTPDGSGVPYVDVDPTAVLLALESTVLDLSDDATRVGVWELAIGLYGRTTDKVSDPEVWALHVSEYVGE